MEFCNKLGENRGIWKLVPSHCVNFIISFIINRLSAYQLWLMQGDILVSSRRHPNASIDIHVIATLDNRNFIFFSSEHYSYIKHNCEGASRRDSSRQVPVCPICFKPVPAEKGQEDYAVSQHIDKFCKTQTKIYTNSCSFNNCKKKELVQISCSTCKQNFCLKHRHENVHKCKGPINQQRNKIAWVLSI